MVFLLIGLLQIPTITLAYMTTHRLLMKLSLLSLTCVASVFKKKKSVWHLGSANGRQAKNKELACRPVRRRAWRKRAPNCEREKRGSMMNREGNGLVWLTVCVVRTRHIMFCPQKMTKLRPCWEDVSALCHLKKTHCLNHLKNFTSGYFLSLSHTITLWCLE